MEYDCGFTNDNKWFRYRAALLLLRMDVFFLLLMIRMIILIM